MLTQFFVCVCSALSVEKEKAHGIPLCRISSGETGTSHFSAPILILHPKFFLGQGLIRWQEKWRFAIQFLLTSW